MIELCLMSLSRFRSIVLLTAPFEVVLPDEFAGRFGGMGYLNYTRDVGTYCCLLAA